MNQPRCSAISAGHVCLDIIPDLSQYSKETFTQQFIPGRLIKIGSAMFSTGGSVANTGLALHRLGVKTSLVGKLGADYYGEIVQMMFRAKGEELTEDLIISEGDSTSYTLIINPHGMDRIFLHNPGANNSFSASDLKMETIGKAGLFHYGYPPLMTKLCADSGKELVGMYRKVKDVGLTTSLDLAFPDVSVREDWSWIFSQLMPSVDLFNPSIEELIIMYDRDLFDAMDKKGDIIDQVDDELLMKLSDIMISSGCAVVLIKLGHRGLFLRTAGADRLRNCGKASPTDAESWADLSLKQDIFKVQTRGTTGAGDTCIAGFLSAFLRDYSPQECLRFAAATGACCCEQPDAYSGLPDWEGLTRRLETDWQ